VNQSIKLISFLFFLSSGFYFFFNTYFELNYINIKNNISENPKNNISKLNKKVSTENFKISKDNPVVEEKINNKLKLNIIEIEVKKNQTFFSILNKYFSSAQIIIEISNAVQKVYDLKKLKVGQKIYFLENNQNKIEKIIFEIDKKNNLEIHLLDRITVNKIQLKEQKEIQSKEYIIKNSLYLDGIKNEIPIDILIKLIKLYSFDLDFQRDIKINTKVSISYDVINIEGKEEIIFGDINYSLISINKKNIEYFKFKTDDGYIDYFNKKGENVKKSILKTPIDGARLSSSYGMRKHPILGYNKMHRGIDFAAPTGTPIYAGGNGVIEFVGRNGGYGNYIRIRHNNEYKTAYAHLSSFNKGITKGARVNQGDIIGFVGSTGRSTGPHLHYEIIFQNKQINPLKLNLPSGKKLKGEEYKRFLKDYKIIYANHLNALYE
tara:strand:+ start:489 stop:1793 length:1305 start_codon:yes stop_codon:yes gene_type:complete